MGYSLDISNKNKTINWFVFKLLELNIDESKSIKQIRLHDY